MAANGGSAPVAGPSLTVAAVARRLGVAPTTLRTWDRRYGLGPSTHEAGAHRRYGPADVARLEAMRRLTQEGVPAAEAAQVALAMDPAAARTDRTRPARRRRHGGGPVVPLGRVEDRVRGLSRAAVALDSHAVTAAIQESLDRRGVVATWESLLVPVLVGVGERWQRIGLGVDVEHLMSECVLGALRSYVHRLAPADPSRPVVLACAPEEQHALPVHAVAAALAERHVTTRTLGARVPPEALAAAVRRCGPAAVFVWSQLPHTGDPTALAELPDMRPAPVVVLGGPGWARDAVAALVRPRPMVVDDMSEAVGVLATAAGA